MTNDICLLISISHQRVLLGTRNSTAELQVAIPWKITSHLVCGLILSCRTFFLK